MHKLPDPLTKIAESGFISLWRSEWPKNKCDGGESSEKYQLPYMACTTGAITRGTKVQLVDFLWAVCYLGLPIVIILTWHWKLET